MIILDKGKILDTTEDRVVISDEGKILDIMENTVVILDKGKIPRLIVNLTLILIIIVTDTSMRSGTSALENTPLELLLPFHPLSSLLLRAIMRSTLPIFWAIPLAIVVRIFFPRILPPPLMTFSLSSLLLFLA